MKQRVDFSHLGGSADTVQKEAEAVGLDTGVDDELPRFVSKRVTQSGLRFEYVIDPFDDGYVLVRKLLDAAAVVQAKRRLDDPYI